VPPPEFADRRCRDDQRAALFVASQEIDCDMIVLRQRDEEAGV
jgi:hypothetical protein